VLLSLHPRNPQERLVKKAVECLTSGGVIIYPTDTIYGIGCDIRNPEAFERICRIKGVEPAKARFAFICKDLSHLSEYARNISTPMFRMLKSHLPGPFTFILPASRQVPKMLQNKKTTVGLRVPDHPICRALLEELGHPIISTSLPGEDVEEYTDPEIIHERLGGQVDLVIDGGPGGITPSTVVDATTDEPVVIRQGAGLFHA